MLYAKDQKNGKIRLRLSPVEKFWALPKSLLFTRVPEGDHQGGKMVEVGQGLVPQSSILGPIMDLGFRSLLWLKARKSLPEKYHASIPGSLLPFRPTSACSHCTIGCIFEYGHHYIDLSRKPWLSHSWRATESTHDDWEEP